MHLSNDQMKASGLSFRADGTKRHRTMDEDPESLMPSSVPPHPLGIKPLGNKYFAKGDDARKSLNGALRVLPDELLMQLLEFLDQRSLRLLGSTCRFLFAHCLFDDLWKSLFLE